MCLGLKLVKCIKGQYNKVFLMTMDNGAEAIAKIPNPNADPSFYTVASEVATRDFVRNIPSCCAYRILTGACKLRSVLDVPVPRIYSYSSDPLNPVGAEYMIEENATGVPLGSL